MAAVDGDPRAGCSEICELANTWRRLRRHIDMLIYDMVGIVGITKVARALSQTLSEVPRDYVLPETYASTFMLLFGNEFNQCDEMRNEYKNGYLRRQVGDTPGSHKNNAQSANTTRLIVRSLILRPICFSQDIREQQS